MCIKVTCHILQPFFVPIALYDAFQLTLMGPYYSDLECPMELKGPCAEMAMQGWRARIWRPTCVGGKPRKHELQRSPRDDEAHGGGLEEAHGWWAWKGPTRGGLGLGLQLGPQEVGSGLGRGRGLNPPREEVAKES